MDEDLASFDGIRFAYDEEYYDDDDVRMHPNINIYIKKKEASWAVVLNKWSHLFPRQWSFCYVSEL